MLGEAVIVYLAAVEHARVRVGAASKQSRQGANSILLFKPGKKVSVLVEVVLRARRPVVVGIKTTAVPQAKWLPANISISIQSPAQPNRITLHIPPDPWVVIAEVVVMSKSDYAACRISDSAGMPSPRCSFQAMVIVSGRLWLRIS